MICDGGCFRRHRRNPRGQPEARVPHQKQSRTPPQEQEPEDAQRALGRACFDGAVAGVQGALDAGADVNAEVYNSFGQIRRDATAGRARTAANVAAGYGRYPFGPGTENI